MGKVDEFYIALYEADGVVKSALKLVGANYRDDYRQWAEDAAFRSEVKRIQNDIAQDKLAERIAEGDTSAIVNYMKLASQEKINKSLAEIEADDHAAREARKKFDRKVKSREGSLTKLLKAQDKYSAELSVQVSLTAQLYVRAEMLVDEMCKNDYQPVRIQYDSHDGAKKAKIDPTEKLYLGIMAQLQKSLRALGMNVEARGAKKGSSALLEFIDKVNGD